MKKSLPRLLIAGTGSGCGKTTVVCGLLAALCKRGETIAAFKCGPDYIDPMFHRRVIGVPSRNLDLFLCGEEHTRYLLAKGAAQASLAIIEGVMGFYDGLSGTQTTASSFHLSEVTETPVILVVDGRGKSLSLAAELQGFCRFVQNRIGGVIVNGATAMTYPMYQRIIEEHTSLIPLGYLPILPSASFESRHLGLVTADEILTLQDKVKLLGETALQTLDLAGIVALAQTAPSLSCQPMSIPPMGQCRIGVAQDPAFCFYYEDNLELLRELGAELVPFSPLADDQLPMNLDGAIFGGGYPELYGQALSENHSFLRSLTAAARQGMPIYGECGGFLYLQQGLSDQEGNRFPMAGLLPGEGKMTNRLCRFGYLTLTAQEDNFLCGKGEVISAHEFHYSDSDENGSTFLASKPSGKSWSCFQSRNNILGGYPHLHFYGNPAFARRLVGACVAYRLKRRERSC